MKPQKYKNLICFPGIGYNRSRNFFPIALPADLRGRFPASFSWPLLDYI
jgi:hypothetical protein